MEYLSMFWSAICYSFWDVVLLIETLIITAYIQRIIFLEYQTKKQLKIITMLCGLCTIGIFSMVGFTAFSIVPFAVLIIGTLILVIIPFIASGLMGREKHRWIAFFEWIPLIGYLDGFNILWESFVNQFLNKEIQTKVHLLVYLVLIIGLSYSIAKPNKFMKTLISDIKNRSLRAREEIVVWLLGIWLLAYSELIQQYVVSNSNEYVVAYVNILNFVLSVGIVLFIINGNYREYYYKKNIVLQKALIFAMANLVENRDENTGGHIQRTSRYVEIIAEKLKKDKKYKKILTDEYVEDMVIAAPLHDVGKIHISDAILNKPGKLDDEEFSIMKTHAAAGGEIIAQIEETTGNIEYLKIAKEMAKYHHERMDGKGYPYGLEGNDIPLCARILAVADVFDALVSKRCYKDAMPIDKAFSIIEEEKGSHFDNDVANAFIDSREAIEEYVANTN